MPFLHLAKKSCLLLCQRVSLTSITSHSSWLLILKCISFFCRWGAKSRINRIIFSTTMCSTQFLTLTGYLFMPASQLAVKIPASHLIACCDLASCTCLLGRPLFQTNEYHPSKWPLKVYMFRVFFA